MPDVRFGSKQTCATHKLMSALGQKRTLMLFDHLVGLREQRRRDFKANDLGGDQVDDQVEFVPSGRQIFAFFWFS